MREERDKKWGAAKGQALVEMALMLPLFLLLIGGVVEFGSMFAVKQIITNAAREGARMGVVYLDDSEALVSAEAVSKNYLTRSGVSPSRATIDPVFSEVNGTPAVQVTIGYDYTAGLIRWIPGIPETVQLTTQVVMRKEA